MSKDKYRPSISADEVIRRDLPQIVSPPSSHLDAGGGISDGIDSGTGGGTTERSFAPRNLRVVSQKVYYSPEGQQFVEVTFEWDEVPGATEYLVRIA